jgi:hypothetical protein
LQSLGAASDVFHVFVVILQLVHEGHLNTFLMIPHLPNLISDQLKQERLDLDMLLHGNSRS